MIEKEIEKAIEVMNEEIANILESDDDNMQDVINWIIETRGKQLRPKMLLWVFYYNFKQNNIEEAIIYASVLEIIHMASLVHDDIVDNADTRRGKETVLAKFGPKMAVYAGDYMIFSVFEKLYKKANTKFEYVIQSLNDVCYGELGQNGELYNINITKEKYLNNIYGKTAVAFENACKTGAIVANLSKKEISVFSEYGKIFGMLFQIRDDLLDYQLLEDDKTRFIDFPSGIYTLPIILVSETEQAKNELLSIRGEFEKGNITIMELRKEVIYILQRHDWIEEFNNCVDEYYIKVIHLLDSLQEGEVVSYLRDLVAIIRKDIERLTLDILNT